jgi:hypothetical protein
MVDFKHLADYFLAYEYQPPQYHPGAKKPQPGTERVKGVRINCKGDIKMLKRPHYEAVEVPITDPIFTMHDTSDIAERIGIPIMTRKVTPDPKWAGAGGSFENYDATVLHKCLKPNAKYVISPADCASRLSEITELCKCVTYQHNPG